MDKLSKNDISFRIDKLKSRVSELNNQMNKYSQELEGRYEFAKGLGVKRIDDGSMDAINNGLESYIQKADDILSSLDKYEDGSEQYSILNNMIYLDDVRLGSISELVQENKELRTKEYIQKIGERANLLIRSAEIKDIDKQIYKLSKKCNFIEKLVGKDKVNRALVQNYALKRMDVMNKIYIPENKSLLEIVNITKNCGFKSEAIDDFITKVSKEYELGDMIETALVVVDKKNKIPFFYNKEFMEKVYASSASLMTDMEENKKKKRKEKTSEMNISNEALINDILTLELFNFEQDSEEVI